MATVEELKLRIRELENELIKCKQQRIQEETLQNPVFRPKIEKMSAEVVDSNPYRYGEWFKDGIIRINRHLKPYGNEWMNEWTNARLFSRSRLMALKRMGIVEDYEVMQVSFGLYASKRVYVCVDHRVLCVENPLVCCGCGGSGRCGQRHCRDAHQMWHW